MKLLTKYPNTCHSEKIFEIFLERPTSDFKAPKELKMTTEAMPLLKSILLAYK